MKTISEYININKKKKSKKKQETSLSVFWKVARAVMRGRIICSKATTVQKVYIEYQCQLEEVNEM